MLPSLQRSSSSEAVDPPTEAAEHFLHFTFHNLVSTQLLLIQLVAHLQLCLLRDSSIFTDHALCSFITLRWGLHWWLPSCPDVQPASLPIDAQVSTKIKAKIWADDFIDFSVLLSNNFDIKNYQIKIVDVNDEAPKLSLQPSSNVKITQIETWSSAFSIFVAVYTV